MAKENFKGNISESIKESVGANVEQNIDEAKQSHDTKKKKRDYPLQYVKGIGPKRAEALWNIGIRGVQDLIFFFPKKYIDRRTILPINQTKHLLAGEEGLPDETTTIVIVKKLNTSIYGKGQKRLTMRVADETGEASIVFFRGADMFVRMFQPDDVLAISGTPEIFNGSLQWVHPEIEKMEQEEAAMIHGGRIIPQYRETQGMKSAGVTSRFMRTTVLRIIDDYEKEIVETLPQNILEKYSYPSLVQAVRALHFPEEEKLLDISRRRMKFEELFYFEMGLALQKEISIKKEKGIAFNIKSERARTLLDNLGFSLTAAQLRVVREICSDMGKPEPMNRLLQGDVGSGKTIVAILSAMIAIDNGYQVAFMAPTEILAEQHTNTLKKLLEPFGIKITQLVGSLKKRQREYNLYDIRTGETNIIVGTHALFQETVEYKNLGFIIIDEQHRFGVVQRALLMQKGVSPDTLIMTATPIPRTLTMTLYGDLDVSIIDELPKNRKPIRTRVMFESLLDEVWDFVNNEIEKGRQAYVVYPLVEKSEKIEMKSAVEHYEFLSEVVFPNRKLGLLHGQMFWYEKEDAMRAFLNKEIDILVATTVIEVGIDVPNASIMVIENAERFGLSQLHQLRGRVGRGAEQSYCLLVTKDHFKYAMRAGMSQNDSRKERKDCIRRLQAMEATNDGFKISEIDLELRGPGDFLGTRQSGLPDFRHANIVTDGDIVEAARTEAFAIVEEDFELNLPKNSIIKEHIKRLGDRIKRNYADIG